MDNNPKGWISVVLLPPARTRNKFFLKIENKGGGELGGQKLFLKKTQDIFLFSLLDIGYHCPYLEDLHLTMAHCSLASNNLKDIIAQQDSNIHFY